MRLALSEAEIAQIRARDKDPADYEVLTLFASNEGQLHQRVRVPTPQGTFLECLIIPFGLTVPIAEFKAGGLRVLDANGKAQSPASGILPIAHIRIVVPRAQLAASTLAAIEGPIDGPLMALGDAQEPENRPGSAMRLFLPPEEA